MALSGYPFASNYAVIDNNGNTHFAIQRYKQNGNVMLRFYDLKQIQLDSNGEYDDNVLSYNNGTKLHLYMKHVVTQSGANYIHGISGTLKVLDQNDVEVSGLSWNISDTNIVTAPYDTFPLLNTWYFACGKIGYQYSLNVDTIVGDPAVELSPFGHLYCKTDNLCPEFADAVKENDIAGHAAELLDLITFYDDNTINGLKNSVKSAGDGADPFTSGEPSDDPDPSQPGGGDKPSIDGGDTVNFPNIPGTNVISSGLISMYNPDNTLLRQFAGVLWGNDFEQSIKKILNDPFDGIIGLSLIPFDPHTLGSVSCVVGNYDTEISMPAVDQQYMQLDCGSLKINESWHNALDYSPATDIDIFIPFVGFKRLKTEDAMNNTIYLKYNVDLLTGAAVAFVKCGDKVMYTYPCKLSYDVPLTGSNKSALYTGMINVAMSAIRGASMGGALGAVGGAATSAISTATSKQSDIERSGAITSNTGELGEFTPYIIIHRPVQSMPADFKTIKGYQSNITAKLNQLTGYTEVDYIHLEGISGATDSELEEIESLLKEGVII